MEAETGGSNSVSQSSRRTSAIIGPGGKFLVEFWPSSGAIVGQNAGPFKTAIGDQVRLHIPINIPDFRKVPACFKDAIWASLTDKYEFNVEGHVARPIVEALYPQKLRTLRNKYRQEYLAKASSMEEAKANVPPAVSADLWIPFVEHEFKPEVVAKNAKFKLNRSLNKIGVAVGRQTYSQIHYKKEKEDPTKKRCRVDDWLSGHEHPDGTPLESAKETYEKVKEIHVKMLESGVSTDDINSDALSQVLGEDKKNRVRGIGSYTTKKQLESASLALSLVNPSQSFHTDMAGLKAELKAEFKAETAELKAEFQEVKTLLKAMARCTSGTDTGSTSAKNPSSMESPRGDKRVILLGRDRQPVAKGFVDDSVKMCHGREVEPGEKRVYIQEILDPDAAVYDGPQDGNMTLNGWIGGGFIIWLAARMKYDL